MAEDTKQRIIGTFLEMTESQSVEKISVVQLMRKTGLQRETYYYYFDDKYALIEATLRMLLFDSYSKMLGAGSIDDANRAVMENIVHHKGFYNDLLSNQNEYMFKRIYCGISVMVLNEYLEENFDSVGDNVFFAAKFYAYAVNNIVYEWIQHGLQEEISVLVQRFRDCLPVSLAPYFNQIKQQA